MRLFKANPGAQSEEDRARDLRLTSIAARYRARSESVPEVAPELQLVPPPESEQ